MNIDRRSFVKGVSGLTLGAFTPLMASESHKEVGLSKKSPYETLRFDVIVVGAGAAGVPAAVAAARRGVKVVLLEEDMTPGGAPVDMYVTFLCGMPRVGIFNEIIQNLNLNHTLAGSPSKTFGKFGFEGKNHWWMPSSVAQVVYELIGNEKNLTLMCGARVEDVIIKEKGNRTQVQGVRIVREKGMQDILGKVVIDATGTGCVAAKAGCQVMYGSEAKSDHNESVGLEVSDGKVQSCTWMMLSQRLKKDAVLPIDELGINGLEDDFEYWASKKYKAEMLQRDAGIYLHWGATVSCKNTLDPVELAASQRECLTQLIPRMKLLYEAGFMVHLAPRMGVRECRRIKGEYILTVDDVIQGRMPDDKVADAWYALDAWGMKLPKEILDTPPYGIPYRSLIPVGMEGFLTAGRVISGTKLAHSSYRVQPICAGIGQAAGTAAAMIAALDTDVRSIDVKVLQQQLSADKMFDGYGGNF
ncbi:MAG: FAD-dependent oxidoreductase [Dysgonamonadaceae bacterium]|jgi:hypothetical protein|nr:FAD-dependent oxidoreductase [Dysgonamonadaceae bacterium]